MTPRDKYAAERAPRAKVLVVVDGVVVKTIHLDALGDVTTPLPGATLLSEIRAALPPARRRREAL